MQDPLTGLRNRRGMDEMLGYALARAKRDNYPMVVIMLDLDHFKHVNDTYGHAAGDEVLKSLANRLKTRLRENDLIYRYGGEEFVLAMPGMTLTQAFQKMEGWRIEFSKMKFSYGEATIMVTFSAGIAGFPEHGEAIGLLLSRADEMLYRSKKEGRNRVTVCST